MIEDFQKYRKQSKYDIVFFFLIEFPMEQDGVRPEDEEYRVEIEKRILALFEEYGQKYIVVR